MTVYDVHKHTLGNTTMKTWGVWPVFIVSTDAERGTVMARWNGNEERKFFRSGWSKWRLKKPVMIKSGWGQRPARRDELKAMKEAKPC